MRCVVVGMGVQGVKRQRAASPKTCITVDNAGENVDFRDIRKVPLDSFEVAYLCTPDAVKFDTASYLLEHGKHVLVEKPFTLQPSQYDDISSLQNSSMSTLYVAYNHRFEPHIAAAKEILDSGELGDPYTVSLSYGNGTAELVRLSEWRDTGMGVIADLGSHLLDIVDFWWGLDGQHMDFIDARKVENRAFDYAAFRMNGVPNVWGEATLLSWRNDFRCDIQGSEGSLHISGLCKWGPTSLTVRNRIHPSGRPDERTTVLVQPDPTWQAEDNHFMKLISAGELGNLSTSREIARILGEAQDAVEPVQ